jgi:hypothetical protein
MAFARSNAFNADMNQDLLQLIEQFQYEPYGVRATSGYRPGDSRQHGRGTALDLELYDPKTNQALENYQDPSTFSAYQQYANALYQHAMQTNPELAQKLRWGGYFSGPKGKYGAMDLMHFDVGGGAMGGGSWAEGLTPEQAALWGLQPGGGIGAAGGAEGPVQPASNYAYGPEQRRAAIAAIESQGSGDYSAVGPVTNRQGNRAYGKYQVMASNIPAWTKQALGQEMTPEQFLASPEAQDKVFDTIFGDYAAKYGERGAASMWFTGQPNEPDVKDVLGTTGKGYVDKYMAALGQAPSTGPSTSPAATGVEPKTATPATAATKKGPWDKLGGAFKTGLAGMGKMQAPVMGAGGNAPQMPTQAPLAMESMPIVSSPGGGNQRDQLALLMQQLNSGRLWG